MQYLRSNNITKMISHLFTNYDDSNDAPTLKMHCCRFFTIARKTNRNHHTHTHTSQNDKNAKWNDLESQHPLLRYITTIHTNKSYTTRTQNPQRNDNHWNHHLYKCWPRSGRSRLSHNHSPHLWHSSRRLHLSRYMECYRPDFPKIKHTHLSYSNHLHLMYIYI